MVIERLETRPKEYMGITVYIYNTSIINRPGVAGAVLFYNHLCPLIN